jgi:hypothetical protein
MANFLHFIEEQGSFVGKLRTISRRLLIVEYDGRERSHWIPFPLNFSVLRDLLRERGFSKIAKVGTRASRFGGEMYSVWAES